ncbi:dihydrofolate reductase [Ilyomonas limi]|uniref:Dihydrofolate reductase n=1 Tax=Ilyomonas limi TaxID=2575867 RepID=A0A4U3KYH2_9BACT|nr:dihydrofolate reductase family protein [Ilyomonas limi]TKK67668.1 dihydrofolate reductase [Ilyomonas limi]
MRKLVLGMTVTADGFVCGPNHELDWFMRTRDKSVKDWIEKSLWEGGVHIMGRCTFEVMAPYWVTSSDQLAEPMNRLPKVIFSKGGFVPKTSYGDTTGATSPYAFTWANAAVATDLVADITKLKQQEGKPILAHGGASFAQELVKHGLVDEYRFAIHPVVIGKGISMFATIPHLIDLQLVSSTPFVSGAIINIYTTKNN